MNSIEKIRSEVFSGDYVTVIDDFLTSGQRKIDIWYKENNYKYIYFDEEDNYFDNINTIEQLNKYNNVK